MLPRRPACATIGCLLLTVALAAGCRRGYDVTTERVPLPVGDETVALVVHTAEAPGLTYLNLHDDENTAAETALAAVRRHGGRLFELQHGGERDVAFALGDSVFTFDPNRIFTDAGAAATLADLGASGTAAEEAARGFARALLARLSLGRGDVLVTVHNNTDDDYSLLSYTDDGEYAADVLFVHHAAGVDPDDFFFVTDEPLYTALRDADVNVVMQDNAAVTDDGSLSVYSGRRGLRYVNVEAQHGHFEYQLRMLELLNRLLAEERAGAEAAGAGVSRR